MSIYYLQENQTSFEFYNTIIPDIATFYREINDKPIEISMEKVEYIDAPSLVNLLALGYNLSRHHGKPIHLHLAYKERLLYFLYHTKFFYLCKELNIFEYDEQYVGGFSDYMSKHKYRDKHQIHFYPCKEGYYDIADENEQESVRAELYETMREYVIPNDFSDVINDIPSLTEYVYNEIIDVFVEICCNSVLYSEFGAFCFLQTNKFGTKIVVSDVGIGFQESFKRKGKELIENRTFSEIEDKFNLKINKATQSLFEIFEVLEYSRIKRRKNLWELKSIVQKLNGDFKIHYNNIQVVFSHNRCGSNRNCHLEAKNCFECLLKDISKVKRISPIRNYKSGLSGVHIEIDIPTIKGGY